MRQEFIKSYEKAHGYKPSASTVERFLALDWNAQQGVLEELSYRRPGDRW